MHRWHRPYLGRRQLPSKLSWVEVEHFFTLTAADLAEIRRRRRTRNRLGIALQFGCLRLTGRIVDSLQRVPPEVLRHLGEQLEIRIPDIATLRSLYRRQRTRFEHERLALALSGFSPLSQAAERNLISHLRHEAESLLTIDALAESAKVWLYQHRYLIVRDCELRRLARGSLEIAERKLCNEIEEAVDTARRRAWGSPLLAQNERRGLLTLEWLRE